MQEWSVIAATPGRTRHKSVLVTVATAHVKESQGQRENVEEVSIWLFILYKVYKFLRPSGQLLYKRNIYLIKSKHKKRPSYSSDVSNRNIFVLSSVFLVLYRSTIWSEDSLICCRYIVYCMLDVIHSSIFFFYIQGKRKGQGKKIQHGCEEFFPGIIDFWGVKRSISSLNCWKYEMLQIFI